MNTSDTGNPFAPLIVALIVVLPLIYKSEVWDPYHEKIEYEKYIVEYNKEKCSKLGGVYLTVDKVCMKKDLFLEAK